MSFKLKACNFIKKGLPQAFFCEILEIFKNIYFADHLKTAASVHGKTQKLHNLKKEPQ